MDLMDYNRENFEKNLERVFFADPWGFGVFNEKEFEEKRKVRMDTLPIWKRAMFKVLMTVGTNVKPLSFFRIDFVTNIAHLSPTKVMLH